MAATTAPDLGVYRDKRDFSRTSEPSGAASTLAMGAAEPENSSRSVSIFAGVSL